MKQCISSLSLSRINQSLNLRSLDPTFTFTLFNVDTNEYEHICERNQLIAEDQGSAAKDQLQMEDLSGYGILNAATWQ
jgi:hypothetical protein